MATPSRRVASRPQGPGQGLKGKRASLGPLDNLEQEPQEQVPGQLAMLRKAQEFFQTCDAEGKGFIARRDMQRFQKELPLTLEELEDVFDALDADGNGFLTPEEFATGFSHFFSQSYLSQEDAGEQVAQRQEEKVYQSQGDEELGSMGEDEEAQFQVLMEELGARRVLEDENDVKQLWLQLKKDEPHLLSNFEDFLTRIISQLQEAHKEKSELECALKRKIAAYDEEIQRLYEEMEQQIKREKEQFLLKLEGQCAALHNDTRETKTENARLKLTNQELARELERISQELQDTQQQLESHQQEVCRLHQEKEMEVYRVTESLQREKSGLLKQLDFLRERNKHLRDEQDMRFQKEMVATAATAVPKASWKRRSGSVIGKYVDGRGVLRSQSEEEEDVFGIPRRRSSLGLSGYPLAEEDPGPGEPGAGGLPTRPLRRIISIEEDPLPQLLQGASEQPLSRCPEEEEPSDQGVAGHMQQTVPGEVTSASSRGQPVGTEALATSACVNGQRKREREEPPLTGVQSRHSRSSSVPRPCRNPAHTHPHPAYPLTSQGQDSSHGRPCGIWLTLEPDHCATGLAFFILKISMYFFKPFYFWFCPRVHMFLARERQREDRRTAVPPPQTGSSRSCLWATPRWARRPSCGGSARTGSPQAWPPLWVRSGP
ncbi:EF-hand calcium-binding domain-containing protein 4B isoform X2 [Tupaia chinensis]|uniref:EF-hand calcium-binding domain-containing protein 4B isoform X2 n=1 Tax=Tupaia chinensis TaxID=246437 RepID=UPI000FFB2922|nr:EF-hand calcium-binding domain-containing protein 4B isoform X2 [Tupaia chinensis]